MSNPLMTASAPPTMQAQQGPANPMMQQSAPTAPQGPQVPPGDAVQANIAGMNMSPQDMAQAAQKSTYAAQELGKLAKMPDLSPKDVVSATGQAVADGQLTTSAAVNFLSGMPQDETKLRPWVSQLYMQNLVAAVHLKAAMMKGGAQ